ncbi:hypothetical protein [Occallatibacter riparius]|uniref:Uncharacterized protein n=1 Tax=Occallatibacter riparius TaxID=1002689 RepID=A0A9J7BTM6_9BACT|nr:hypothetical protein [Occallatibacter riparius]UWZ86000.1 hypothetical protein MOP44_08655 [Occallatibacter riparius]
MKLSSLFKRVAYCGAVATWIFAILCVIERPAYAYVDPGSGLFFLQVIGSTFVGFGYLARKRIAQLFGVFGKGKNATQSDVDAG